MPKGGVVGLGEKGDSHRHRQQYGNYQRESGVGEVEEGIGRISGGGRRLNFGWSKHITRFGWGGGEGWGANADNCN